MKKLNTAVIGVGNMGKNHARIYSQISNLVAIADPNRKVGKVIAEEYGAKYYEDYRQLLDKEEIDAISIVVPTHLHRTIAEYALRRGIPSLLEKPISDSIDDAESILNTIIDTRTPLLIGHIERFNPAVSKAKALIDAGRLGSIVSLLAIRVGFNPPLSKGSDVTLDLGIHDTDIFNYLLKECASKVTINTQKIYKNNIADVANIMLEYSKAVGLITTNWVTPTKMRKLYITGTEAFLELDYIQQKIIIFEKLINKKPIGNFYDFISLSDAPQKEVYISKGEPLLEELKFFLDKTNRQHFGKITQQAFEALKILRNHNG